MASNFVRPGGVFLLFLALFCFDNRAIANHAMGNGFGFPPGVGMGQPGPYRHRSNGRYGRHHRGGGQRMGGGFSTCCLGGQGSQGGFGAQGGGFSFGLGIRTF